MAGGIRSLFPLFTSIAGEHWNGIPARQIDRAVRQHLQRHGLISAMAGYRGYPAHSCVSANAVAVHGVPGVRPIQRGDILTLDVAARAGGWVTDTAWTYLMPGSSNRTREFYFQSWRAFRDLLIRIVPGISLFELARESQRIADSAGLTILPEFVGHGIGRDLHEPPVIPFVLQAADSSAASVSLQEGMTVNIEPVYTAGGAEIVPDEDGWGFRTTDGTVTAHFELSVLIGRSAVEILQLDGCRPEDLPLDPPFGLLPG